ncbi:MAG TPA: TetR/AcrR family transcriptional regulator [Ktedonobacteraceae bacterium]|nr:TetR/AcrR family transcriptional regulator [Ktedonobacteraceae bacterium]
MHMPSDQQRVLNETEERIREVALRLFAQKGFPATGTREIASEVGLTVAGLYYYVGTKEELLLNIVLETSGTLLQSALLIGAGDGLPEQKLALLMLLHVWFHGEHALEASVINTELRSLSGEAHARALNLRDRYESVWREVIAQGNAGGIFQVQDVKLGAIALIEMGRGLSHWYHPQGDLTLREICYMHADWALGLVRAARDGKVVRATDLELVDPQGLYLNGGPTVG